MTILKRRHFLMLMGTAFIAATLPGCQGISPEPFVTGRTVTPPQGCTEMLKRDKRGDC